MFNSVIKSFGPAALALQLTLAVSACGKDEESESADCQKNCPGDVSILNFTGNTAEISFEGAEAGSKYIIMPFALGAKGTWDGGSEGAVDVQFTFSSSEAAALRTMKVASENQMLSESSLPRPSMKGEVFDSIRHELERVFVSGAGLSGQPPRFWQQVDLLDQITLLERRGTDGDIDLTPVNLQLRKFYMGRLNLARPSAGLNRGRALTESESCLDEIEYPDESDSFIASDGDLDLFEADNYCLYIEVGSVSAGSVADLKESIERIHSIFKNVIYSDEFSGTSDDYKFLPHIVVLDAEGDAWPDILGGYSPSVARESDRPIIYMPHDISKISSHSNITDATLLKRSWYATLAHEFQHAILDYYRMIDDGVQEGTQIDEGLAHLVEDIFGFGDLIFEEKVGSWLKEFPTGVIPFLPSSSNVSSNIPRRAPMHALSFYLASQSGKIEYTDGVVSGGSGLAFVKGVAENDTTLSGPITYQKIFGVEMTELMGKYLAALVLDGRSMPEGSKVSDGFKTMGYQSAIKDVTGNEDGIFGFNFNNFEQVEQPIDENADKLADIDEDGISVSLFQTQPIIYAISDPEAKITITTAEDVENSAVTVVRVK